MLLTTSIPKTINLAYFVNNTKYIKYDMSKIRLMFSQERAGSHCYQMLSPPHPEAGNILNSVSRTLLKRKKKINDEKFLTCLIPCSLIRTRFEYISNPITQILKCRLIFNRGAKDIVSKPYRAKSHLCITSATCGFIYLAAIKNFTTAHSEK